MTKEKWGQLRQKLLKSVGQNNYTNWIEPIEFRAADDGIATFDVPTNFLGNYVNQNFADLILHELRAEDPSLQRLRLIGKRWNTMLRTLEKGQSLSLTLEVPTTC